MKRYFLTLAVGSLLMAAPVGYGTAAEQNLTASEVINSRSAQTEIVNKTIDINKVSLENNKITAAKFVDMLASEGINIDELNIDKNKQLTTNDAASLVVNIIRTKGIDLTPFAYQSTDINPMLLVNNFGIIDTTKMASTDLLNTNLADNIIKNLVTVLSGKSGNQNSFGVTYTVIPQDKDNFNFELLWGRKSSSGYSIKIKDTVIKGGILYVSYTTSEPQPGSAHLTVITHPKDTLTISKKDIPAKVVLIKSN